MPALFLPWGTSFIREANTQASNELAARGADAVILFRDDAQAGVDAIASITAAARETSRPGLLCGQFVKDGTSGTVCAGEYYWSPTDLAWLSERSLRFPALRSKMIPTTTPGCAFCLITRDAWREVGPLDPLLPPSLAGIDFALRAARLGRTSYIVESARVVTRLGAADFEEADPGLRVRGALRLARKHGRPSGAFALAARQLASLAADEVARVDPHADYGHPVSQPRRQFWYLRNVLQALGRDRVRAGARAVREGLFDAIETRAR